MVISKILSLVEPYFEGISSGDVVQWIGVGTSASAAALYFIRWYYLTFVVLNEYECVDFQSRSVREKYKLSDIQKLGCAHRETEINIIQNLMKSKFSQMVALWGADQIAIESIVIKSLHDIQARAIILDFRGAVWVDSLDAWMERMEQTSNPTHLFVKQLQIMLSSLGLSSFEMMEKDSDSESSAKFIRFRTLLSEKVHFLRNLVQKEPGRPFVFVLMGLDRLMKMERGLEHIHGNRYLNEYLEHFVNIGDLISPITMFACLSDNFWINYWVRNDIARRKSWSMFIPPLGTNELVDGLTTTFNLGEKSIDKKTWITEKDMIKVSKLWGNNTYEVMKVMRYLSADPHFSIDQLLSDEIQQFVLKWFVKQKAAAIGDNTEANEADGEGQEESSDDGPIDDFNAMLITGEDGNVEQEKIQVCDEMKIIRKIATTPGGKVHFQSMISYKHRKYLKIIMSMIKRNVLQLEMCVEREGVVKGCLGGNLVTVSTPELLGMFQSMEGGEKENPDDDQIESHVNESVCASVQNTLKKVKFMLSLKRPVEQLAAQYMCKMIG